MPSRPPKRAPLAFSIRITPEKRGFVVETFPSNALIRDTVAEAMRGQVALHRDRPTTISALASVMPKPSADGKIGPPVVRDGFLELAQVGAEQLYQANANVEGFLYNAVVCVIAGSLFERDISGTSEITVSIVPSVEPMMRVASCHWWRDMRHVIELHDEGVHIRLCGVHHINPFAAWANARILKRFRHRLATHLRVPLDTIAVRNHEIRAD